MFSYYERMLAVVPRWSIAPRLNPQSVAEHSYFVTLYTDKLTMILGWSPAQRHEAVAYALRHDMVEAQTGDTPGPIKRLVVDKRKLKQFEKKFFLRLGQDYRAEENEEIKMVVKAADLIDELFWVSLETQMGNRLLEPLRAKVIKRLNSALGLLGLHNLCVELIDECANMARGIDLPENNDDVKEGSGK